MAEIGKTNHLKICKAVDFGVYLEAGELGEVLLPKRYIPANTGVGDSLDVFLYTDSDDRPIATTEKPKAELGQCALLEVIDVNKVGAFLDWGLSKDLLVPYSQQQEAMVKGKQYVVYLFLEEHTARVAASSKLSLYLPETSVWHRPGQAVELMIVGRSDLGYKAIIDTSHLGLIFHDELHEDLTPGQCLSGFIKAIRVDGKIDLSLQSLAQRSGNNLPSQILDYLRTHDGSCKLTDKSAPADIFAIFQVSKAQFKRALGGLYKQQRINIEKDRICLAKAGKPLGTRKRAGKVTRKPSTKPAIQPRSKPADKKTRKTLSLQSSSKQSDKAGPWGK